MGEINRMLNRWADSVYESVADTLGYNNADDIGVSDIAMVTVGSAIGGAVAGAVGWVAGVPATAIGVTGTATGCVTLSGINLPNWVDNPPKDHYTGISSCLPDSWMGETDAFTDALKKKCRSNSGRIELNNFYPPIQMAIHESCDFGLRVYALFKAEDLDCSIIKPH